MTVVNYTRLKQAVLASGMSNGELSKKIGINRKTLYYYLINPSRLKIGTIVKISKELNIDLDKLLSDILYDVTGEDKLLTIEKPIVDNYYKEMD